MIFDALIVGAGPAGAAAAVSLAQKGRSNVLLLDRSHFPRDKTCGSGLSPNALKLAATLGIADELKRRANPIETVKILTRGGREMVLSSNANAVILLRKDFDNLLVERARSLGVTFLGGVHATGAMHKNSRVIGVRSHDGREFQARHVLFADGAHSIFSQDPRPKHSISTLMGWWEDVDVVPKQLEMVFDSEVAPLYGWLFPETATRVNIGICIDGQDATGTKTRRNVRDVFSNFLSTYYEPRLRRGRQVGRFQGHPIVYTTWVNHCAIPGALFVGEAARITHNATGEGISQAMQSGIYAAEAVDEALGGQPEADAWRAYVSKHRKRFTASFVAGHALRKAIDSPLLDHIATAYGNPLIRQGVVRLLGSALAGSSVSERTTVR